MVMMSIARVSIKTRSADSLNVLFVGIPVSHMALLCYFKPSSSHFRTLMLHLVDKGRCQRKDTGIGIIWLVNQLTLHKRCCDESIYSGVCDDAGTLSLPFCLHTWNTQNLKSVTIMFALRYSTRFRENKVTQK